MKAKKEVQGELYDLTKLRLWADASGVDMRKMLREADPPKDLKKSKAKLFAESEKTRIKQALAKFFVDQIWERMKFEAKHNRRHAIVYAISLDEIKPEPPLPKNHRPTVCSEAWLKGTAKKVFEHCERERLRPFIEGWSGGPDDASRYGFNIVVRW